MNQLEAIQSDNGVILRGQPTRYIPGPDPQKMSLVNKLCKILDYVGAVPKNGENTFHHYKYTTENDLTNAVRKALAAQGVMLIFGVESMSIELVKISGGKGEPKDGYSSLVMTSHVLIDGDSGEQIIFQIGGHAAKSDDKGIFACLTGAQKYALQKLFLIPSEESEPERDINAAFTPEPPPAPAPAKYRNAGEDPAVQARIAREEAEFKAEQARKTNVAQTAARGGMKAEAEPVKQPEPEPKTGYPAWCDYVKDCGEQYKGLTLAKIALDDPKTFATWQTGFKPKATKPGGKPPEAHVAFRAALDDSTADPLESAELAEVVAYQEKQS
jgi:hypothetical protein